MTKVRFKTWIEAMRLRTLPLALSSVLTGAAVSPVRIDGFGVVLFMIILTTLLLQILSNLANDYGDSQHGTDNAQRVGPMRTVQSGAITKEAMKTAIVVVSFLALLSGILLLYFALAQRDQWVPALVFFGLGLAALAAAVKYTAGKNPYGYRGLGDASVLLFFGVIGVAGSAYLLSGTFHWTVLLPATSIGCFATAVLNLNNMRDHENDAASGKRTLVVVLGFANAKKYHAALFILGWSTLVVYVLSFADFSAMKAVLAVLPIHALHLKRVNQVQKPQQLDPELKKIALSAFFASLILLIGTAI